MESVTDISSEITGIEVFEQETLKYSNKNKISVLICCRLVQCDKLFYLLADPCFRNVSPLRRGRNLPQLVHGCSHSNQVQEDIYEGVVHLLVSEFGVNPVGRFRDCPIMSCDRVTQPGLYWITNGTEGTRKYCS